MHTTDRKAKTDRKGWQITVVGTGLIGTHAAPLLAQLPGVTGLRLIDGDTYSESNCTSLPISPGDVGQPKVKALARRVRRQAPDIVVDAVFNWVEQVPRSLLRGDVVLACVDSRRARCRVNEICCRLGIPLLDSGVDGRGLLARTNVYRPGPGRPCLECSWGEADYAALEQVYACQQGLDGDGHAGAAPTNAPGCLGSIAAGLLVSECQQLLAGHLNPDAECRQVLWDVRHQRCLKTRYTVNPNCRFDHGVWGTQRLAVSAASTLLGEFLEMVGHCVSSPVAIQLAGLQFVRRLVCSACGAVRDDCLYLDRALAANRPRCKACGLPMAVSGFHAADWLSAGEALPGRSLRRTLSSIGFRTGDIVTVMRAGERHHFELAGLSSTLPAAAAHRTDCEATRRAKGGEQHE